jgi:hypothetical protein
VLPQSNARVTGILDGGASTDYDYDGGADASLWSGSADGYVSEAKRLVPEGDKLNRLSTDTLIVDELDFAPQVGQYVQFTDDEGTVQTRKITDVGERPVLPGLPVTTKLYLESE